MGMLLRRHYADAEVEKPVEQPEAESVKEMPKEEIKQADVTEETNEVKRKPGRPKRG